MAIFDPIKPLFNLADNHEHMGQEIGSVVITAAAHAKALYPCKSKNKR